jgi:hypothetical protein
VTAGIESSRGAASAAASCIVATLLVVSTATAESPAATDPLHPTLRACAALSDDAERLACYDRAVERLASGAADNMPPPSPEDMFGMDPQLSRETSTETPVEREELPEISARVVEVQSRSDGGVLIRLDNGQIWMPVDQKRALVVRAGDTVRIVRGALGAFRMVSTDQRSSRVRRVR